LVQLKLFEPGVIKFARLVSPDSPRQAFYNLWLELFRGKYTVRKESGGRGMVFDSRLWCFESREEAEIYFDHRVREKTAPNRRSPRKYFVF